jgi:hypothetical protein
MKGNLRNAFIIFVLVWIGAYLSRRTGYYYTFWFTDVSLHILSGIGFGYIALAILGNDKLNFFRKAIFLISVGVLGSYLWEVWEFSGWHLIPTDMPFYGPILGDSLGDIGSGILGTFLLVIYLFLKNQRDRKH